MRTAAVLVVALLAAVASPARAEIYKWIDERGVTNYGSKPPEGARKVRQLDESAVTVSTIPAPPRRDVERARELALEARVDRLERELHELERSRTAVPIVVVQAAPAFAPVFFGSSSFVHPFAHRAVFPRRVHAVVRHAPVRGVRH